MSIVLTNSSKFQPFTFDEIIKPYQMYTEEYNTIEAGLADLDSKAELMRQYAEAEPDAEWSKRYINYANEIDKQAESLAKNGLTPGARSRLLSLNRQYNNVVTPIETAIKKLDEANKYRANLSANKNVRFKKNRLSISDVYGINEADNSFINLDDLASQAAALSQAGAYSTFNDLLASGMTYDDALAAVNAKNDATATAREVKEYVDDAQNSAAECRAIYEEIKNTDTSGGSASYVFREVEFRPYQIDTVYEEYPYTYEHTLCDVEDIGADPLKSEVFPTITFSIEQVESGKFAPVADAGMSIGLCLPVEPPSCAPSTVDIRIYSKEPITEPFIIPTIKLDVVQWLKV